LNDWQKTSPVFFGIPPLAIESRGRWQVALEYDDEGDGPYIIDLSHVPKWDVQGPNLARLTPFGLIIPEQPGQCVLSRRVLLNRMNAIQAAIWNFEPDCSESPEGLEYTEIADALMLIALAGLHVFSIAEKLSSLDFRDPKLQSPFFIQGPFAHIPCQLAVLAREPDSSLLMLACSGGYGRSMVQAIRGAGEEFGLRPAGQQKFRQIMDVFRHS